MPAYETVGRSSIRRVSRRFETRWRRRCFISIPRGGVFGLIGGNGAAKRHQASARLALRRRIGPRVISIRRASR
jgi:hypothetical protein